MSRQHATASADDIESIKENAAEGNADAEYQLGGAYLRGSGVPRNAKRAAYWLERAAMQCSAPAMDQLGQIYLTDDGPRRDTEKAARLFRLSAAQGNSAAFYDWGDALIENRAYLDEVTDDTSIAPGCPALDVSKDDVDRKTSSGLRLYSDDPAKLRQIGIRYIDRAAALGEPRAKALRIRLH